MPRMPQPQKPHECGPNCAPGSSTSENIKLKVLEDRLKAELAPRDLMTLKEAFTVNNGDFLYIYDNTEEDVAKRLKAVLVDRVQAVIIDRIEEEIHEFALRYELVSALPHKGEKNVIYFVPVTPSPELNKDGKNKFDEYIWIDNAHGYEKFGCATIDLSAYRKAAAQDIIDNQIKQSIINETNRAKGRENEIAANLSNEVTRAKAAEQALEVRVRAIEADYLTSEDYNALVQKIQAEETRAKRAETALQTNITRESNRAVAREDAIAGELAAETTRATNKETALNTKIENETNRALDKEAALDLEDESLSSRITAEANLARANEAAIGNALEAETTRATGVEGDLWDAISVEAETRGSADSDLSDRVSAIEGDYLTSSDKTELQGNIDAEVTRASNAEGALDQAKADKATTLAGYGIVDSYTITQADGLLDTKADKSNTYTKDDVYTKAETESAIDAKLQFTFRYKGSVATYSNLPVSGNVIGDVWNVEQADPTHSIEAGDNVAWNGSDWDKFGGELAVDSAISSTSTNPVQNCVIYQELNNRGTTTRTNWDNSTVDVGGIHPNTDLSNKSVLDILDLLLHPYVAIKSPYISITPSTGTYLEKGYSVTVTQLSGGCTKGSKATSAITVKLLQGSTELETGAGTTISKNVSIEVTEDSQPTFKFTASDGDTNIEATAPTYTWLFKSYWGVVSGSVVTPTEAQIKGLTSALNTKSTRTMAFNMTGQKAVYAYPSAYGNLTKIEDSNGFNVTSSFDRQTVSITNIKNVTTTYNVYTLSTPVTSNMTYKFMF